MLNLLKLVILCGFRVIRDYFAWMIKFARNPKKYPLELRYSKVRSLIRFVLIRMRLDLSIENFNELKNLKTKSLLVSNHQSMIDILLLISISSEPVTFVAKDSVKKFPFVGKILMALEGEFLKRDDPRQSIEVLKRISKKLENQECHVCIYPEGHRNKKPFGDLLDFHPGSLKPAFWTKTPILSFSEFGTFRIIGPRYHMKSHPVFIKFSKVMNYDEYSKYQTPELTKMLQNQTFDEIKKFIALDEDYLKQKKYKTAIWKKTAWWESII